MSNASKKPTPAVGDVYEDRHSNERNRRLRLTSEAPADWNGRPRFVAETISNDERPHLIGKTTVVAAHSLRSGFTKVESAPAAD
ncbi:hypothetical protein DEJ30_12050 [Curtobacterium sp. MCPF17_003]|uniref:hypothetical protein n=1 Tax=Curtobacterium sp. MCPF17_003 TaxID=2175637 RepID=UPI000D9E246F|nr:hypothetical protein [Curtobacterium sp. MCPF17_003]PYY63639.1 hypothetical protein DEJ30_12050 [Curtobacterium sp. MCPF17_003]